VDSHFKKDIVARNFVNEFLNSRRDRIINPEEYKLISTKVIASGVHVLMRFHLYDMLLHSLGKPAHAQRVMVAPSALGQVPGKLLQASYLSWDLFLQLIPSVALPEELD
jgi:hypothetical protein